jgi:hypothetical protein
VAVAMILTFPLLSCAAVALTTKLVGAVSGVTLPLLEQPFIIIAKKNKLNITKIFFMMVVVDF